MEKWVVEAALREYARKEAESLLKWQKRVREEYKEFRYAQYEAYFESYLEVDQW